MANGIFSGAIEAVNGTAEKVKTALDPINMQNAVGFGNKVVPGNHFDKSGNVDYSSNSSLNELRTALSGLTGNIVGGDFIMGDGTSTGLGNSAYYASNIATQFNGVNQSISSAWDNVSNFTNQTNSMVKDAMQRFTNELRWFIESTYTHETEVLKAANTANDLSGQLLKDLQSSFETFYSNNQ